MDEPYKRPDRDQIAARIRAETGGKRNRNPPPRHPGTSPDRTAAPGADTHSARSGIRCPMSSEFELPLRVLIDQAGTPVIRALCGAELAAVWGSQLTWDFSPAGLIRMILHAKHCDYCRAARVPK